MYKSTNSEELIRNSKRTQKLLEIINKEIPKKVVERFFANNAVKKDLQILNEHFAKVVYNNQTPCNHCDYARIRGGYVSSREPDEE